MGYYGFMYSSEFTMVDPSEGSTMQTVLNHADSSQPCRLSRDQLVRMVKRVLHEVNINATSFSGITCTCSFRIEAASMAAASLCLFIDLIVAGLDN